MKKISLLFVVLMIVTLASCSTLGALLGAMETQRVAYVMDESSDIYGEHRTVAILVNKKTEGLAASDFATRFLREELNGEVVSYGIQFREQDNLTNDGYYYMTMFPLIRVDGVVYDFPLESLPEYQFAGDIRFKEVEVTLSDEAVEALKNAQSIAVQFYSVNDVDQLIEFSEEDVQATRDFFNGVLDVEE